MTETKGNVEDHLDGDGSAQHTRQFPSPTAPPENANNLAGYRTSLTVQRSFTSEADRVAALTALHTFQAPPVPDPRFDSITKLMASIFKTPFAVVSLIGEHNVEAKYVYGPVPQGTSVDRQDSVCTSILKPTAPEMLVVEDLTQDRRFANNPFVRDNPHLRFYAGAPLVGSDGMRYGTLCTMDTQPRQFPATLLNTLVNFAELATRELEREKEMKATSSPRHKRLRKPKAHKEPVALLDMSSPKWKVLWNNPAWTETTGISAEETDCASDDVTFWNIFIADHGTPTLPRIQSALAAKEPVRLVVRRSNGGSSDSYEQLVVVLRPASDSLDADVRVGIPAGIALSSLKSPVSIELGGQAVSPWFAVIEKKRPTFSTTSSNPASCYSSQSSTPRTTASESPRSSVYAPTVPESRAQPQQPDFERPAPYGLAIPERYQGLVLGPLVGVGSFGRVHRAFWKDQHVAIKVIDIEADSSEADVRAMLAEALLHPDVLRHPNIVRVLDYCYIKSHPNPQSGSLEHGDSVWIVFDYCDGGRLGDAVSRGWLAHPTADGGAIFGPDLRSVLRTAADIAAALVHLHSYGVVHGDLTCTNILLATDATDPRGWVAKVSDFGQSCVLKDGPRKTRRHGTLIYMPPELLGEGILTLAADVYSLGICMWEMYTGCQAYGGLNTAEVIMTVCEGEGHLPLPPTAPTGFKNLIAACMEADRLMRPTAKEVLTLVRVLLQTC